MNVFSKLDAYYAQLPSIPAVPRSPIVHAVDKVLSMKEKRGWDKIYWAIDLHDTIISGTYNKNNEGYTMFQYADMVLKHLTQSEQHKLILWTSSYEDPIKNILDDLANKDILFDFFNENPLESNNELCNFSKKFYFNILLDDKAGFQAENIIDSMNNIHSDWWHLAVYFGLLKINNSWT